MKSLKITLIIIFSVLILDKIVFFSLKKVDEKVLTGGLGRLNHFSLVKDTTKIIFFGSSRVQHHINPIYFGKSVFNMGVSNRKIAYYSTLIKTLEKDRKQVLFIQIDPYEVFDTLYDGSDIKALNIMQHKSDIVQKSIQEINMDNPFSPYLWSLDYNGISLSLIKNRVKPQYNFLNYNGYDPISNTKEQKQIFMNRLKNSKEVICEEKYKTSGLVEEYLKELYQINSNINKKVIFFTSPYYKDKCLKDNQALKRVMEQIGFKYYDFSNLFDSNADLDLWKDESHLSKKGADLFSKMMFEKLKEELIIN
ncbi:MAG TPA: hypothetical protein P5277_05265 [Candidatus Paceibacterota bacterium]|nr:hypothetical protein [Candidatus Paceibacterota bacterium]